MKHIYKFHQRLAREKFIELLGEDRVEEIQENNWVKFFKQDDVVEMAFFTKDGKGDDVVFCSVCYDQIDKKWFSSNCIDSPDIEFDTYEETRDHLNDIEDEIINNGFDTVNLP